MANAADAHQGKVQVRLYTKGAAGQTVWVSPAYSEARRARFAESPSTPARSVQDSKPISTSDSLCRPLQVRNTKGAMSYYTAKGQHLIRCTDVNRKAGKGASYCTADLPCANGAVRDMQMTCAKVA